MEPGVGRLLKLNWVLYFCWVGAGPYPPPLRLFYTHMIMVQCVIVYARLVACVLVHMQCNMLQTAEANHIETTCSLGCITGLYLFVTGRMVRH